MDCLYDNPMIINDYSRYCNYNNGWKSLNLMSLISNALTSCIMSGLYNNSMIVNDSFHYYNYSNEKKSQLI